VCIREGQAADVIDGNSGAHRVAMQTNIPTLDEVERKMIIEALLNSSSNIAKTAKILGISRSTLYFKLKRYKIRGE
jgi:transcriptional regulator of acetoin/glycerol metabolism